ENVAENDLGDGGDRRILEIEVVAVAGAFGRTIGRGLYRRGGVGARDLGLCRGGPGGAAVGGRWAPPLPNSRSFFPVAGGLGRGGRPAWLRRKGHGAGMRPTKPRPRRARANARLQDQLLAALSSPLTL